MAAVCSSRPGPGLLRAKRVEWRSGPVRWAAALKQSALSSSLSPVSGRVAPFPTPTRNGRGVVVKERGDGRLEPVDAVAAFFHKDPRRPQGKGGGLLADKAMDHHRQPWMAGLEPDQQPFGPPLRYLWIQDDQGRGALATKDPPQPRLTGDFLDQVALSGQLPPQELPDPTIAISDNQGQRDALASFSSHR